MSKDNLPKTTSTREERIGGNYIETTEERESLSYVNTND